jgi:hypothetical protein
MAGTARYTAILDANVMFPVNVFDILAQAMLHGFYECASKAFTTMQR